MAGGGGRICFAHPAGLSSFCDCFFHSKYGGGGKGGARIREYGYGPLIPPAYPTFLRPVEFSKQLS